MNIIRNSLIMFLMAAALMFGCKKQEVNDNHGPPLPGGGGPTLLQQLFANNVATARQGFTMNAAIGGELIADKGTRLQFEPGALLHLDGTPVTGAVDVTVVEVLGMGDMIWLNKQTVGNDNGTLRLLRSGGAINVSATQGGNTLRIAQGGLLVRIPTEVGDPAMQLFIGNEAADGTMIWDPIDSTVVTVEEDYFDLSYAFPMDSLQWINCDYFPSTGTTTSLTATVPDGQPLNNTQVWTAFPSENAVLGMLYSGAQTFTTSFGVPVGLQAVVVGLHYSGGVYYSSFNPVTVTSNMTVPLTFTETTLEQFQADVNGL